MGELSCLRSVHKAMENTPSILVHSYRPSKELAQPLRKINIIINPKNAAEHDLVDCYVDGETVVNLFGQVKDD